MPIAHPSIRSFAWRACLAAGALIGSIPLQARTEATAAAVGVVRSVAWSPGDAQRSGACEFEIFIKVAQLQQQAPTVGIVGVGNHNGRLSQEAERALDHVILLGVPVVKVARAGGSVAATADALYIDAGGLSEARAQELLLSCLNRYGAPPAAVDPAQPTEGERAAIRRHLETYRRAFVAAQGQTFASVE